MCVEYNNPVTVVMRNINMILVLRLTFNYEEDSSSSRSHLHQVVVHDTNTVAFPQWCGQCKSILTWKMEAKAGV